MHTENAKEGKLSEYAWMDEFLDIEPDPNPENDFLLKVQWKWLAIQR